MKTLTVKASIFSLIVLSLPMHTAAQLLPPRYNKLSPSYAYGADVVLDTPDFLGVDSQVQQQRRLSAGNADLDAGGKGGETESLDGGFEVREQNDDLCNSGTRQWTGTVDVGKEKKLFFWFFESRRDPKNDPVVIWLQGGPGASSMYGLFSEVGPCLIPKSSNHTYTEYNPHSWSNFANMLFIDQPAGTGFSTVSSSTLNYPSTLHAAAVDFSVFLTTFFSSIFPSYSSCPLHLSGESFAGAFLPVFASHISSLQKVRSPTVFTTPVRSLILVDSCLARIESGELGYYDVLCRHGADGALLAGSLNETACAAMEHNSPACEALARRCVETYDRNECSFAVEFCAKTVGKWFSGEVDEKKRNWYDDRLNCTEPPMCIEVQFLERFLNQENVRERLGIEGKVVFNAMTEAVGYAFEKGRQMGIPTTREVVELLEAGMGLLSINGNNDVIQNTEGQLRVYDSLPWSKQARFRAEALRDWYWPNETGTIKGGQMKRAGKLAFYGVDGAGHTSPGDQKEAVAFMVQCWLEGGWEGGQQRKGCL